MMTPFAYFIALLLLGCFIGGTILLALALWVLDYIPNPPPRHGKREWGD